MPNEYQGGLDENPSGSCGKLETLWVDGQEIRKMMYGEIGGHGLKESVRDLHDQRPSRFTNFEWGIAIQLFGKVPLPTTCLYSTIAENRRPSLTYFLLPVFFSGSLLT